MKATLAAGWARLQRLAEYRLPALTRLKRVEALPIVLHRRRIYAVPTRAGLVFALVLLVMLLGSLNYLNNPALLLTCLLGVASCQSVFAGARALNRVELRAVHARPCSAGERLHLRAVFHNPTAALKPGLRLLAENAAESEEIVFDVAADDARAVDLQLSTSRRGWMPVGRLRLWTEHPFGLFHIWNWLHPDTQALIYPRPERAPPPLPLAGGGAQARVVRQRDEELSMLRDYRPGDPRHAIAWKASARHGGLLVKEHESRQGRETVLDWRALEGLDHEARIARLAAWVDRAESTQTTYLLVLPQQRLGPASGPEHRHACLRALALLPEAGA